jgi:hypothetical protein
MSLASWCVDATFLVVMSRRYEEEAEFEKVGDIASLRGAKAMLR